jgi:hypothetical protein
MGETPN